MSDLPAVLFVIGQFALAGAEAQLARLASRLANSGVRTAILVLGGGVDPAAVALAAPCPVTLLPGAPRGFARVRALAEVIRLERWELAVGQLFSGNLYAVEAARRCGVPAVTFEGGLEPWSRWYHWSVSRRYWRRAALIEVNSRAVGNNVKAHGGASEKLRLVYNAVEPQPAVTEEERRAARRKLGLAEEASVVTMVANLHPPKDPATLLRAAALLTESHPRLTVLLAGRVEELGGEIETLRRELGLGERVRSAGSVADVRPYLAAADVFCLSSRAEGLSNAILEAMAAGVPCLVSDAGGNPELITDGERGLVFQAGDAAALAAGLGRLLSRPEEARRLADAARAWVSRELSWERNLECHLALYREALACRNKPRDHIT